MSLRLRAIASLLVPLVGCAATVEGGLDEAQANEVLVALDEHGLDAEKQREEGAETFRIEVPQGQVAEALGVLRAEELPRHSPAGLEEVFGEGSLVPTATEERARLVAGLGGELATSLETIEGVLDARVHLALPDPSRFRLDEERPRPRASVLLKHRGATPPYSEEAVRALVAGAIEDMRPEDVAVVGVPSSPAPEPRERGLAQVGPFAVATASAGPLKAVLVVALLLHLLLASLLVVVLVRRRAPAPIDDPNTQTQQTV